MKSILTSKNSTNIEEKIKKIEPKHYWIISALLAGLLAFLVFSVKGILGAGQYIILCGDGVSQYAPVIQSFIDSIRNGESIWYSFSAELGINMAYQLMFTCWSPFNILYLILGFMDVETITQIVIILKVMSIAAAFTVFSQKVVKTYGFESIFFSLCYAMGGYTIACGIVNFSFLDAVILLPLVLTATVSTFETERKYYWVVITYALLFITCFHLGYSIGIFTLLFVVAYLVFKFEEKSFKAKTVMFLKWAGCVCVAILISGVFLLPGIIQFINSGYEDAGAYYNRGVTVFNLINTFFIGTYEDYNIENSMLYSGVPVFILTILFFADKGINKKERFMWGTITGVFLLAMSITPLYYALCAFDVPNYYNYRFGFAVSFACCVMAMKESERLKNIKIKSLVICVISLSAYYLLMIVLQDVQGRGRANSAYFFIINLTMMFAWLGIFKIINNKSIEKNTRIVIAVFMIMLEIIVADYHIAQIYFSDRNWYENYTLNLNINADTIAETDTSFYRIISVGDDVDNSPLLFDYNGVNLFATCRNEKLVSTMEYLGFANSPRYLGSSGSTPVTRMLLGIKYMINPGDYTTNTGEGQVAQPTVNSDALNIGYMVDNGIRELSINDRNAFDNSNMIIQAMTGSEIEVFVPAEYFEMVSDGLYLQNNEDDITIGLENSVNGHILLSIPRKEEYQGAYMQFETATAVFLDGDYYYVTGGDNVYGKGTKFLSSQANEMVYKEEQDAYYIRVDAQEGAYNEYHLKDVNFRYFSQEALDEAYNDLAKEQLIVSEWKDGYVKGKVTVTSGRQILFLSIPYEKGWNIKVNGQKTEPIAVLDGSFMALELPGNGNYDIEMKFICPGFYAGAALSIVGVIITLVMIVKNRDKKHTEDDDKEVPENITEDGDKEVSENINEERTDKE